MPKKNKKMPPNDRDDVLVDSGVSAMGLLSVNDDADDDAHVETNPNGTYKEADVFAQANYLQSAISLKNENDLLGLSGNSANGTATHTAGASFSAAAANNELLGLEYHDNTPTGDLIGLDQQSSQGQEESVATKVGPSASQDQTTNELLSLDYAVEPPSIMDNAAFSKAMQLDDAYNALEEMRKANLEIEFGTCVNLKRCVQCIRLLPPSKRPKSAQGYRLRKYKHKACLMCGSPTCKKHSDPNFLNAKIAICADCSIFFSLDFVIECVTLKSDADEEEEQQEHKSNGNSASTTTPVIAAKEKLRRQHIKHMVDVYDRVHLLLTYSAQFIDEICKKLETNTKKEDRVGLSSNTIGIASGIAGIAAAVTIITPAGPPLVIASLLFGATAQAGSSGSKLVTYYSAPNKVALKIISYYNLLKSILSVTTVLRDALMNDHINLERYTSNIIKAHDEAMLHLQSGYSDEEDEDVNDDEDWESDEESLPSPRSSPVKGISNDDAVTITTTSLKGIKEDEEDDFSDFQKGANKIADDSFGDFQEGASATADDSFGDFQVAVDTNPESLNAKISPLKAMRSSDGDGSPIKSPRSSDSVCSNNTSPTSTSRRSKLQQEANDSMDDMLMERKDSAGKLARFYSRTSLASTSLIGAATVTVFAGAALSVAHVAFEAKNLANVIKRIKAGSPSKRVQVLQAIKSDIMFLPQTSVLVEEWDKYLTVMEDRRRNKRLSDASISLKLVNEDVQENSMKDDDTKQENDEIKQVESDNLD
mmetsp:Transcript_26103/g.30314  ORF Transcript_26103/g.30314 Transcript_26103/m.30314 type:complete len:763 (-) Transcript_26103:172-2460(-)